MDPKMEAPSDPVRASAGKSLQSAAALPVILAFAAGALLSAWGGVGGLAQLEGSPPQSRSVAPRGELLSHEQTVIGLFRHASPSVVHVTAIGVRQNLWRVVRTQGTGTGFVWDEEGHIVTNFHVINNAGTRLARGEPVGRVTLADRSEWNAVLVGVSVNKDLAVLKIDAPRELLHPLPLGTSHDLSVGQTVLAIGNPFGLDQTLTTGVISALGREIESLNRTTIHGVIQTDAAINPGNSGGPLLDSAGRLIGVNTAIFSTSGAYAGIGFAIPVDTVMHIVPSLVQDGDVATPALGVELSPIRYQPDRYGLYVHTVLPGSQAQQAGLRGQVDDRYGDIIISIEGKPTPSMRELQSILQDYRVGQQIELTVLRHGEREPQQVRVQLR